MEIRIQDTIREVAPGLTVVAVEADIHNGATSDELWALLDHAARDIAAVTELGDVNKRPAIKATREVYKALGKEPNRYRPSAEALTRRAVKGMELYRINTVVDLINLVSLLSGYSIGGFDADKIDGDTLTLGVGAEGSLSRPSAVDSSTSAECLCTATTPVVWALLQATTSVPSSMTQPPVC